MKSSLKRTLTETKNDYGIDEIYKHLSLLS